MRWLRAVTSKYVLVPAAILLLFRPPQLLERVNRIDAVLVLFAVWIGARTLFACAQWRTYGRSEKTAYFRRVCFFASVICFVLVCWSANGMIQRHFTTEKMFLLGQNGKGYELHTLELYPYTAFHPRANCRVQGPMPEERNAMYDDFDVESGDHGFFVDFDLDNPPAKEAGELRILLIGGSTAQGFGGQTNDDMLYRLLERRINPTRGGAARRVRVINLALANSTTYQNFVALNKWGHALTPDLILSFSGFNDVIAPLSMGITDCPLRFQGVLGLTRATWVSESPRLLTDAAKYVPSLNDSTLGLAIRTLHAPELGYEAGTEYVLRHHYPGFPSPQEFIVRQYLHALQSIKRDFQGIPIMVAFQPTPDLWPEFMDCHRYLLQEVPGRLQGYVNSKWHFRDVNKHFRDRGLINSEHMTNVHLLNKGHRAAADFLAAELAPILDEIDSAATRPNGPERDESAKKVGS